MEMKHHIFMSNRASYNFDYYFSSYWNPRCLLEATGLNYAIFLYHYNDFFEKVQLGTRIGKLKTLLCFVVYLIFLYKQSWLYSLSADTLKCVIEYAQIWWAYFKENVPKEVLSKKLYFFLITFILIDVYPSLKRLNCRMLTFPDIFVKYS